MSTPRNSRPDVHDSDGVDAGGVRSVHIHSGGAAGESLDDADDAVCARTACSAYLYLVHARGEGGSPEEVLLNDWPLIVDVLLWVAVSAGILAVARE